MNDWNYDIDSCPLDTKVRLLSADNCFLLPQMEFVGTLTDNGRFITEENAMKAIRIISIGQLL